MQQTNYGGNMKIAVVDGQGGGIGKLIIEKLRSAFGNEILVLALGTNALATSLMLKAGANEGATGENAIVFNSSKVDIIIGNIGIICANSMLGELTPVMAQAISESSAIKVLIPLNRCNIQIAGINNQPLPHYIDEAISMVGDILRSDKNV
jgi:NAD(P)-dependent dehydrogenase (short-subunit alcohol dehydrogenase family)